MSASKIRVGIISANWGAYAHLPAWRSIPVVEVVGICTSRRETAEAAAARCGVARAFWDYQVMAADTQIDCGTRPNIRYDMVLSALRAGKHVYNGIPFAADLERAHELHEAWRDSGRVGCVDAFVQWLPAHRLLKEMIDEGFLGQPFGGPLRFHLSLFNQPRLNFPFNWFAGLWLFQACGDPHVRGARGWRADPIDFTGHAPHAHGRAGGGQQCRRPGGDAGHASVPLGQRRGDRRGGRIHHWLRPAGGRRGHAGAAWRQGLSRNDGLFL